MFLGLIGCFIPIIPSPITSWFGFLILYFSSNNIISFKFLIFTLLISILFFLGDFFLPLITAKKFGSSKKGIIGTGVGLFLGFFILGPIGIILGACIGAFIGELMNNKRNEKILGSVGWCNCWGFVWNYFKISCQLSFSIYIFRKSCKNLFLSKN